MKFTLLPKPAIAFLPRHLHFQLALLTSAALLITFIAYEWHSANNQSEFAQNGVKLEALALARNIAVTGSDFIVSKDFAGLEDLLVRTIDLPAVLGVRITGRQGKLLSDVAKKADGTPEVRFSSQAISVPSDIGAVSRVDYIRPASGWRYEFGLGDPGRMVVWQPIISGTLLGWVVVDYSMASSAEIRRRIWSDSLVAIAIAILVSILLLLLLRLGTTQAKLNKQAASLLASEQLLQSVLDSALDAFIRINEHGEVTDWNLQAERMFGYSRADAVGKVLESLIIPPSFQMAHRRGLDHFLKTGEGPLLGKLVEVTAVRASGGEFPVEIAIVESRIGNIISFNAFVRDISARKQAEKEIHQLNVNLERRVLERTNELNQFKNTLDQTLEAVYIFDPDTLRFTYVNEGAKRQTGYSQTELMQMTPVDFNKPMVTVEKFKRLVQPLITGVQTSFTFQSVHRHKDGHDIPVEIFLQLVHLEGQAPRFVAMVNDISARKQVQEEILQLNAELEERVRQRTAQLQVANQDLEAFSYSVSHDLRTPLTIIDGYSSLLGKEIGASAATERGKLYLARIRAAVVQMGELIDALLSLAQVSRTSLRRESVELSALAETVLNAYREREPGRAVQLAIQPGLVVQGDPGLLRQVLDNLLGNAWKYSSKQPQTHIIFRRESGPDGEAVYTVRDHGAGFDMAYSDQLFGVFQRLHTASEFEGTGIGLATVHKIITRHGGRIWAESAPGQGATFYFTLEA